MYLLSVAFDLLRLKQEMHMSHNGITCLAFSIAFAPRDEFFAAIMTLLQAHMDGLILISKDQ
jgi:hypothetical protein